MSEFRLLAIDQLDRALGPLRAFERPPVPRAGWIKAIREALGLSGSQLAARLGVTKQSVNAAERREASGDITLNQLRRVAAELDAELFYALIPRDSISTTVERRAEALARREAEVVSHTMALEDQATSPERKLARIQALKERLMRGRPSRLWD